MFTELSYTEWKELATKELKGKGFEGILEHNNIDGISYNAYYNKVEGGTPMKAFSHSDWLNIVTVNVENEKEANAEALQFLENGANGIEFNVGDKVCDLPILFNKIFIDAAPITLQCLSNGVLYTEKALAYLKKINAENAQFTIHCANKSEWGEMLKVSAKFNNFRCVYIGDDGFEDASIVQKMAFSMAQFVEILEANKSDLLSPKQIANKIHFTLSLGNAYFIDLAAIRACRVLWANVCKAYSIEVEANIHIKTNNWNLSSDAPNSNMLRATTQAMAAIIGGCNSLQVMPHTKNNAFAKHIAKNVSLLLEHESHLNKVGDVAEGAYFIENITQEIAHKAWSLFQDIESKGGWQKVENSTWLTDLVKGYVNAKAEKVKSKEEVILGVNKYED